MLVFVQIFLSLSLVFWFIFLYIKEFKYLHTWCRYRYIVRRLTESVINLIIVYQFRTLHWELRSKPPRSERRSVSSRDVPTYIGWWGRDYDLDFHVINFHLYVVQYLLYICTIPNEYTSFCFNISFFFFLKTFTK